jgi:hypothetical protein
MEVTPRRRRTRRAGGRLARLADVLDRAGQHALLGIWWLVIGLLRALAMACEEAATATWRWLGPRHRLARALLMIAAITGLVLAWRWHRAREDWPVDETEALARVIRSEVGSGPTLHRLHVAWITRNLALERGQTIVEMVCSPCGPQDGSRPESSRQHATDDDRALAREVLAAASSLDPTGGATHFINPVLQDRLARAGVPGYARNPYVVVERRWRRSYGWEPYYRLGPTLEIWGPARPSKGRR